MTVLADLALFAMVPLTLLLFMLLPPRRAVLAAFLIATLLLPMAAYTFEGLPTYNKFSAASVSVLLGVLIFDSGRLAMLRPRLLDIPMVVWCLSPAVSSLTNGLGEYDAFSAVADQVLIWGTPYLMGRLYLGDREGLQDLAGGIILGGLVYVPLCLYEIRMSPQLHAMLYGFHQHDFTQTYRFGGWRPTVFMQHGLAVGMFMTVAALLAAWMWYTGAFRRILGVPMVLLAPPLMMTAVLCKSLGALVLLVAGVVALFSASTLRTRLILLILIVPPVLYIGTRTVGGWSGGALVETARMVDEQRSRSLETRIYHENLLIGRAMERPAFGWGRWGRNRVVDEQGRNQSITDGLWVIAFGTMGVAGLAALYGWLLGPPWVVFWRVESIGSAVTAAPIALAASMVLFATDAIANAMINQLWAVIPGALVSAVAISSAARRGRGAARRRRAVGAQGERLR